MRARGVRHWTTALLGAGALAGCARVPQETVELSTALGQTLVETQQAHLSLANAYFAVLRTQADDFVSTTYRPFLIRYLLTDEHFDEEFAEAAQKSKAGSTDLLDLAEVFTDELSKKLDDYRAHLTAPVDSVELQVVTRLTARYALMSAATAELTGYLGSLADLQAARESTLTRLGLGGVEDEIALATASLSARLERMDAIGRSIEQRVREGKQKMREALNEFQQLRDTLAPRPTGQP
jgi:hypothetical protein